MSRLAGAERTCTPSETVSPGWKELLSPLLSGILMMERKTWQIPLKICRTTKYRQIFTWRISVQSSHFVTNWRRIRRKDHSSSFGGHLATSPAPHFASSSSPPWSVKSRSPSTHHPLAASEWLTVLSPRLPRCQALSSPWADRAWVRVAAHQERKNRSCGRRTLMLAQWPGRSERARGLARPRVFAAYYLFRERQGFNVGTRADASLYL